MLWHSDRKMMSLFVSSMKTPLWILDSMQVRVNSSDIIFLRWKLHGSVMYVHRLKPNWLNLANRSDVITESHICRTVSLIEIKSRWGGGGDLCSLKSRKLKRLKNPQTSLAVSCRLPLESPDSIKLRSWQQDGPKMELTGFPRVHPLYIGTSSRTLKTLIAEMRNMAHVCNTGLHRRLPPSNYDLSLLIGVACRCPHADSADVFLNWYQCILDGHFNR